MTIETQNAVIITLNIATAPASISWKSEAAKVEKKNKMAAKTTRLMKSLFTCKEAAAIKAIEVNTGRHLANNSVEWAKGQRLVPAAWLQTALWHLDCDKVKFEAAVSDFASNATEYQARIDEAKENSLGKGFVAADYLSYDEWKARHSFLYVVGPVPQSGHMSDALAQTFGAALDASVQEQIKTAFAVAALEPVRELAQALSEGTNVHKDRIANVVAKLAKLEAESPVAVKSEIKTLREFVAGMNKADGEQLQKFAVLGMRVLDIG